MSDQLSGLLFTQVCQVTAAFVFVWLLVKVCAKDRPHLAHGLWLLVILKCITPPFWSCPTSPFTWLSTPTVKANSQPNAEAFEFTSNQVESGLKSKNDERVTVFLSEFESNANDATQSVPGDDNPITSFPSTAALPVVVPHQAGLDHEFRATLFWLWIIGAVLGLCVLLVRVTSFLVWLFRCSPCHVEDGLLVEMRRLSETIGIRRRVRLRIVDRSFGPAVLGILRPQILLPSAVVDNQDLKNLRPLIAHELVHIRRGDLVVAMLQAIATSLFWFHPLVWIASRAVTREAERSCDEETIALLKCKPAEYAKSLISVLEIKQNLRVAPALPGVRPVDITLARLERVMRLGNEIHKRTPLKVWCAVGLIGLIVLPGAARAISTQEESQKSKNDRQDQKGELDSSSMNKRLPIKQSASLLPRTETTLSAIDPTLPVDSQTSEGLRNEASRLVSQMELRIYKVDSLLQKLANAKLANGETPESFLISRFPMYYPGQFGEGTTPFHAEAEFNSESGTTYQFGGSHPPIAVIDGKLIVYSNPQTHEIIAKQLARFEEFGFKQVVMETRIVTFPEEHLAQLNIDWEIGSSAHGKSIDAINNKFEVLNSDVAVLDFAGPIESSFKDGKHEVMATSYVEKNFPVLFATLNSKQVDSLIANSKGDLSVNIIQAPTVTTYNGQTANVRDGARRPFVVGVKRVSSAQSPQKHAYQPQIQIVEEGTRFSLTPYVSESDLKVKGEISVRQIVDVSVQSIPMADQAQTIDLQIPEVDTRRIRFARTIPEEQTLVLSYVDREKARNEGKLEWKDRRVIVLLTCTVLDEIASTQLFNSSLVGPGFSEEGINAQQWVAKAGSDRVSEFPETPNVPRESEDASQQKLSIDGFEFEVQGKSQLTRDADQAVIEGSNLIVRLKSLDVISEIAADNCKIIIGKNGKARFSFRGSSKLLMEDGSIKAESLDMETNQDGSELTAALAGSVEIVTGVDGKSASHGFSIRATADKISIDSNNGWVLQGNAHYISNVGDTPLNVRGAKIVLDESTGKITVLQDE